MRSVLGTILALALLAGSALAANEVIVCELMYNSIGDDVEWIELVNASDATIDLAGWYVLDENLDHERMYLSGSLAPREVRLLVGDEAMFNAQYPGVTNYFPVFFQTDGGTRALGNGGDGVNICDAAGTLAFTLTSDDEGGWPTACDGDGPSLLLITDNTDNFSDPAFWTAGEAWGTPGVLTGTVAVQSATWSGVKGLFR